MTGTFLVAAIALGMILLALPVTILSVKQGITGRERTAILVKSGSRLEVEYVHSMYGVRQIEVFSIGPDLVFHLEKVLFGSPAAALYYDPEPSSGVTIQDGFWVIRGNGKHYPALRYRVGTTTHHTLRIRDRMIDLSGPSAEPDGLIELALEKRSRVRLIFITVRRKMLDVLGG